MTLKIYNSLTRKKEEFSPVEKGKVKMYVCGMTVYSDAHIGHARTYLAFDIIRRYLQYKGFDVNYVQNITDVDDKIINAANKEGIDPLEYSKRFTGICLGDLEKLGIKPADFYPKASETIPDMIKLIQKIIENGYGYESDGDVYFSVEKFLDYGKLSGQRLDELMSGTRKDPDDKKNNPFDFALWKKTKTGEPSWDSPWGAGRPGWHIECSAMSGKLLGFPFDIHGGGMDLRFPHHENEIAQAEAATGKQFAKYWMHIGLLTVDGEKMSKSIGNIVNVKDLIKKWDPEVIRFFFAQAHYRSPPDFNEKALTDVKKSLDRIYRAREKLQENSIDKKIELKEEGLEGYDKQFHKDIDVFKTDFESAMDDDFNTPQAIAELFDFVNDINRYFEKIKAPNPMLCSYALEKLNDLSNILTLFQKENIKKGTIDDNLTKQIEKLAVDYGIDVNEKSYGELINLLLNIREEARKNKEYEKADNIRNSLLEIGFEVQDTEKGPIWRKKID